MAVDDVQIHTSAEAATSGGCACGGHDEAIPELDAGSVPHAIRHATVFGALSAISPGFAMDLRAPHDPLPLLAQIEERMPGQWEIRYLQEGPTDWLLRLMRR